MPIGDNTTDSENMIPHNPVLKTTSMVPQVIPVSTYKSLAKVIPGSMFVKNTNTALAKTSWLNKVQSDTYLFLMLVTSCFSNLKGWSLPPDEKRDFKRRRSGRFVDGLKE
jgi:hypothetical protein